VSIHFKFDAEELQTLRPLVHAIVAEVLANLGEENGHSGRVGVHRGSGSNAAGLDDLRERLERIQSVLTLLVEQRTAKDWYTTAEIANIVGKAEYTVREWCRQGRIRAKKKPCGRGKGGEWLISHEELTRLKNEGLLPFQSQM